MDDELPESPSTTPLTALRVFANIVEGNDVDIGVTMLVSGGLVSGMLTSERRYYEALTSHIEDHARGKVAEGFAQGFAEAMEGVVADLLAIPPDERVHGPEVFLQKARVRVGEAWIDQVVMTVRTDRVDAFWVGNPFAIPDGG